MRKAISYLLIFAGIQIVGAAAIHQAWTLISGSQDLTAAELIVSTTVISLLVIALFLLLRWALVSPAWLRTRPWAVLFWCVIAAMGVIIPAVWVQEQMPELPNWAEREFDFLLQNRWGYLAIGLLAPVSEEIVFRGAILRNLLSSPRLPVWAAIALSAFFFALIHMNPAQMPHAFVIGLLLGWMYWRTGSILPGVAYHWANNSVAYVFYNLYPSTDLKLIDIFGGSQQRVLMAVGFSLAILLPALYQLYLRMRPAE